MNDTEVEKDSGELTRGSPLKKNDEGSDNPFSTAFNWWFLLFF